MGFPNYITFGGVAKIYAMTLWDVHSERSVSAQQLMHRSAEGAAAVSSAIAIFLIAGISEKEI